MFAAQMKWLTVLGITLLVGTTHAANLTWNVAGDGNWDTSSANWAGGRTTFVDDGGDAVSFTNNATSVITISANMTPLSMVVSNTSGTNTFSGGPIDGSASLVKSQGGVLTMASSNAYTGGTSISGSGRILVNASGALGSGTVDVAAAAGGNSSSSDGALVLANGVTLANDIVIGSGASVTVLNTASGTATFSGNFSGGVSGQSLRLTSGHGAVKFTGTSSFAAGYGFIINNTTYFESAANFGFSSLALQYSLVVRDSATLTIAGAIDGGGLTTATMVMSNSASLSAGSLLLLRSNVSNPQQFDLNGGTFTVGYIQTSNSLAANINLNGGVLRAAGNHTNFLQGINYNVKNGGAIIDTAGFNVTNQAVLVNSGTGGLTKLGSGALTLTAVNTYRGPTVVSNGTLVVIGEIGTNTTTVISNAVLGGTGTIRGSTTVKTGGRLSPGIGSSVGTLSVSNLIVEANAVYDVNFDGSACDKVQVFNAVNMPSAVTLNVSGTPPLPASTVLMSFASNTGVASPTWTVNGGSYAVTSSTTNFVLTAQHKGFQLIIE